MDPDHFVEVDGARIAGIDRQAARDLAEAMAVEDALYALDDVALLFEFARAAHVADGPRLRLLGVYLLERLALAARLAEAEEELVVAPTA